MKNSSAGTLGLEMILGLGLALGAAVTNAEAPAAPANRFAQAAQDGNFDIANFRFHDGQTLATLHLHYLTLGTAHRNATGHVTNAVLLLHGTGGNAHSLLAPQFSNVLFGPGQPLDIQRYFLIFPDDIGHGQSSKPSDGLRTRFPEYDYDDMVAAQHAMLLDGLHIDQLQLILGTSMGCMQTFVWGETYPSFASALVPLACLPVEIAGRNRMMRYMAIDAIKRDPAWHDGNYQTQPAHGLRTASELLMIMSSSPLQMQKDFPTRLAAEQHVEAYLERNVAQLDADDLIYYFNASRNYNPSSRLASITVPLLWINSADDYINPPELGIAQRMVKLMPNAKFVLLPISDATRGHGTHTQAAVWESYLDEFLKRSLRK